MILQGDGQPVEGGGGGNDRGSKPGVARGTIGSGGRRLWVYPKEVSGRFTRWRAAVAWVLLALYLGVPWLRWNGDSLFRIDFLGRKLVLASHYYWVQDLALLLPAVIASALMVFLVTARFGRVWCGWACPQTVFLQFAFAPLERLVEGRASVRRERDRHPFTPDWIWRKALKHLLFAALAFLIGNTALAYFWGMDNLLYAMRHPSAENAMGLAFVAAFSGVFYWVFAYFREQACVLVCPYAKLQSVLADEKTSLVAYDAARGEPRGRRGGAGGREGLGDCVDCAQCVLVCPTGIDIRMGSQMECIGCTRCIDACDATMTARKWPTGLIRHASLEELQGKPPRRFSRRLAVYGLLALALYSASGAMLLRRGDLGLDALRKGQSPYVMETPERVRNSFTLHVRNRLAARQVLTLAVELPGGAAAQGGAPVATATNWDGRSFSVSGGQLLTLPLEITLPSALFKGGRLDARLVVAGGGIRESVPLVLAGPWRTDG
jgi:cytochrome c oxidase accessory protein FixG